MKCFFCNQRCRLLKDNEPDFREREMTWLCGAHPTRVLHHVEITKYKLRRNSEIQGTERFWRYSTVQWVNDKGQIVAAHYTRDTDGDPKNFAVFQVKKGREWWNDHYQEMFSLDHYPEGFTPENIIQKISTYLVFS